MTSFRCMPEPLQEKVLAAVSNSAHPEALLQLACVNKAFAAQLRQPSADVWWEAAWASAKRKRPAAAAEEQKANPALSFKTKDKLRLAGFNGCMLCGAKSIRKVYWEFSIRCCKDCLIEHSLAENTLKHTFKLQPSTFQHLPHRELQMYKPHAGSFTFKTYWKPILQEEHGVQSFEEYTQRQQQQEQTDTAAPIRETAIWLCPSSAKHMSSSCLVSQKKSTKGVHKQQQTRSGRSCLTG